MCLHPVRGRAVSVAAMLVFGTGVSLAQEGGAAPAATPPAVQQPAAPVGAAAVDGALATVLVDGAKLRCWPTANSPVYEDPIHKDAVLRVGRSEAGFREVLLPIGPQGYVHKNFTGDMQEGVVATKGKGVAFRYRPRSGEAPVTSLPEGSKLSVIGVKDDWWCVRHAGVVGWLPEAEVQVFAKPPETMQRAHAEFETLQRGQVTAYLDGIKQAEAARQLADARRKSLGELQDRFAAELRKAPNEQALDPIAQAADALMQQAGDDQDLKGTVQELQRRIGAQKWVVEATAVRDAQPVPAKDVATVPAGHVADPFDRFQSVGFLRWEKGLTGPGNYVIEKGSQRQYLVTCNSGRYDLGLFVDCEVGIVGSRRRPTSDSLRVLDVEKIEVLAARP